MSFVAKVCHVDSLFYTLDGIWHQQIADILTQPTSDWNCFT